MSIQFVLVAGVVVFYLVMGLLIYRLAFGGLEEQPPLFTRYLIVTGWPLFFAFCYFIHEAFLPPREKK